MKARDLTERLGGKKQKSVLDLARLIDNGNENMPNFSLLIGAGASRPSGIRTAAEMIEKWRWEIFCEIENAPTLSRDEPDEIRKWLTENEKSWYQPDSEYSSLIEKIYPVQRSRRLFIESEVEGKLPSIGYSYLVRLAENNKINSIFTTNFDDLLNEAFYQFSTERPIVCAHDSSVNSITVTSSRAKIIKLHGDYLFDDLKNTSKETQNLAENMKLKFREFLKEYGLIVSGYSGGDQSVLSQLDEMIDTPNFLQNGLYWVFREDDNVSSNVLQLLEKDGSFFVLSEGFDELFAGLYEKLVNKSAPFTSRVASDRAGEVIESYLTNPILTNSGSKTISRHLEELRADRNSFLVTDAINELSSENEEDVRLKDGEVLVFLEVEKLIRARSMQSAFDSIQNRVENCEGKILKKLLLRKAFECAVSLNRRKEALSFADQSIELDPENYFIHLRKIQVVENRDERLSILESVMARSPFDEVVVNRYAKELWAKFKGPNETGDPVKLEDVEDAFRKSINLNPSIENYAYRQLFDFLLENQDQIDNYKEKLIEVLDAHLVQDAFNSSTTSLMFDYGKNEQKTEFRGKEIIDYVVDGFKMHYPKNYTSHLSNLKEACTLFSNFSQFRSALSICEGIEELKHDDLYVYLKMTILYDNSLRQLPRYLCRY
ncbi:MAG: SIR2 family protein [Verrucomicrobiales bacterium]|nr:SIR2 family protein [Verrucomicrobiales bacterium]